MFDHDPLSVTAKGHIAAVMVPLISGSSDEDREVDELMKLPPRITEERLAMCQSEPDIRHAGAPRG